MMKLYNSLIVELFSRSGYLILRVREILDRIWLIVSGSVIDEYKPPEGDGKQSLLSSKVIQKKKNLISVFLVYI